MMKKAAWFRPADTVFFCPITPDSELATRCRKVLEQETMRLGVRAKVVETGGVPLSRQLLRPDLAAGSPCDASSCLPCLTGGGKGGLHHHRAGALYRGVCNICREDQGSDEGKLSEYWGESADSIYARGLDHIEAIRTKNVKNAFAKHLRLHHPEQEGNVRAFNITLEKTFRKPAPRLVSEAVCIHTSKAEILMNSKSEWEQPTVERVVATRQPDSQELLVEVQVEGRASQRHTQGTGRRGGRRGGDQAWGLGQGGGQ